MPPKEPTRQQLSSRLAYQQDTPAFLLRLQNRISGRTNGAYGSDDEEEPQYVREGGGRYGDDDEEWEYDGSGRPPIPKRPKERREDERPPIPERPSEDPGSADEDDGDEKPQVVVLKQGKHLSEREVENIKRAERGLPPLADDKGATARGDDDKNSGTASGSKDKSAHKTSKPPPPSLSFSSSGAKTGPSKGKRKAVAIEDDEDEPGQKSSIGAKATKKKGDERPSSGGDGNKSKKKKPKKADKGLLSFGEDA